MAVRSVAPSTTQFTTGLQVGVKAQPNAQPWVRNKSWLAITAPTASEQKFVGLHAVWPEANFLALTAAGNYTVDWGDGVVENFSSGVTAQHEYDFADADLANTNAPVTLQGGADTVTRTSHGYVNGDTVRFYNIVTTTGISANTPYFVIDATANTFKVSLTAGGSAIDLVSDGSATLLPYKQAIVQVYPQAGQSLTSLNLCVRHSSLSVAYNSGFLDIALAGASLTDFRLALAAPGTLASLINFTMLERANIVRSDCRQLTGLFNDCRALQSVVGIAASTSPIASIPVTFTDSTDTVSATAHGFRNGDSVTFTSVTGTTGIFAGGTYFVVNATANTFQVSGTYGGTVLALTTDGSGVAERATSMTSLFQGCTLLRSVPLFDTTGVTSMGSMFNGCTSLQSVPLFNTAAVKNMSALFQNCRSLRSVPLLNTAATTVINSMFNGCSSLETVPLFNTAAATGMVSFFQGCSSLKSVPLFNTAAVTSMQAMFNACTALESVPLFNTAAVTTMSFMFQSCFSLESVPLFNTAAVTTMSNMFTSCTSLQSVPSFNTAAVTIMQTMFNGCSSLQSVPLFNTASVTNMSGTFQSCPSLLSVPLFNTAAVTTMANMFNGCSSLQSVPALNTTAVTSAGGFSNMFASCPSLSRIQAEDFRFTFTVSNCKLSATALNEIYTNLPTVTSQSVFVTGNYGTASDNPAIATAKGWSVSG